MTDTQDDSTRNPSESVETETAVSERYQSFAEFWKFYACEHSEPSNRRLHFIGILLAFPFLLAGIFYSWYWLLLMPVVGYGFAWLGHFFIEGNHPATLQYPFWSVLGDLKMFAMIATGKMNDEVRRCQQDLDTRS